MTDRTTQPRGYVLVMTLLLLVIAAVALSAVAAESHRRAIEALSAQENLQRRWGAISCQQTLLPRATAILKTAKKLRAQTIVELGGERFALVLADEQAKANINLLATELSGEQLRETLHTLVGPGVELDLMPRRTTTKVKGGATTQSSSFTTYGQVFGDVDPARLIGKSRGLAAGLTVWGDQKLNAKLASPEALAAVAATVLKGEELLRFRRAQAKEPNKTWETLFREINALPDRAEAMKKLVREDSACHSLWIVTGEGQRARYRLAIAGGSEDGSVFEW